MVVVFDRTGLEMISGYVEPGTSSTDAPEIGDLVGDSTYKLRPSSASGFEIVTYPKANLGVAVSTDPEIVALDFDQLALIKQPGQPNSPPLIVRRDSTEVT
jgi:hypothetical protein